MGATGGNETGLACMIEAKNKSKAQPNNGQVLKELMTMYFILYMYVCMWFLHILSAQLLKTLSLKNVLGESFNWSVRRFARHFNWRSSKFNFSLVPFIWYFIWNKYELKQYWMHIYISIYCALFHLSLRRWKIKINHEIPFEELQINSIDIHCKQSAAGYC